jgi:hypothetical protein
LVDSQKFERIVSQFYISSIEDLQEVVFVSIMPKDRTLIERKPSVPQIRGVKGKAVVTYCKPLTTKEMGRNRLSQRVNKKERWLVTYISLIPDF